MIRVGQAAPDFAVQTTDGDTFRLADHRGLFVVLYFFPKAFTPG